jgi:hypothetical protein
MNVLLVLMMMFVGYACLGTIRLLIMIACNVNSRIVLNVMLLSALSAQRVITWKMENASLAHGAVKNALMGIHAILVKEEHSLMQPRNTVMIAAMVAIVAQATHHANNAIKDILRVLMVVIHVHGTALIVIILMLVPYAIQVNT